MKDYISLSTTPSMEDCAAFTDEIYMRDARLEARVYQRQLQRVYGMNPTGTEFRIASCPHDDGTYIDLEFYYDDENQRHVIYMAAVDQGCLHWDEKALLELKHERYSLLPHGKDKARHRRTANAVDDFDYKTDNGPTGHGDICYSDAGPGL